MRVNNLCICLPLEKGGHMSINSEHVKTWRRNTKKRIVEALGGKCVCCGYNRCFEAMEIHHIDPRTKEFCFGSIRANSRAWDKIIEELRKCTVLCSTCHKEIHSGFSQLPSILPAFNENYVNYAHYLKQLKLTPCPVCNKMKPEYNITCSLKCAAKRNYRIDWEKIDLAGMVGTLPVTKIAESLGVSDVTVHKRLKKLGLK